MQGLPTVVTIALALGVSNMAKSNAIVRSMPAVVTLGAVSVVCTDKTGTLTLNQMMVTRIRTRAQQYFVDGAGYDPFSGDVQGSDGALRMTDAAALERLRWLTLPAVIANDGGLVPPTSGNRTSLRPAPGALTVAVAAAAAVTAAAVTAAVAAAPVAPPLAPAAAVAGSPSAGAGGEWGIAGDPTDVAALVLGLKVGIVGDIGVFKGAFPALAKVPFDSATKFVAELVDVDSVPGARARRRIVYSKGAADVLLSRCAWQAAGGDAWAPEPIDREWWAARTSEYASAGLRVLAVVQWEVAADKVSLTLSEMLVDAAAAPCMQINCLLAITDPCRESAGRAVRECQHAGIAVKMVTGDHADTAAFIARELGIIDEATFQRYLAAKAGAKGGSAADAEVLRRIVLQGSDIEAMPKDAPGLALPVEPVLAQYVLGGSIFARVSPEHKLRIVRALKHAHGRITSMTGDGVNDAPALKEAHVGIAMGLTGSDVAKHAAKVILADDLFLTIVTAVRLGRGVYDNITKLLLFNLPTNFAQGLSIVVAIAVGMPTPLEAVQVLTINLITGLTLGTVIALEPPEADVMERQPRDPSTQLLNAALAWRTTYVTALLVAAMLALEQWELQLSPDTALARASTFSFLVIAQCLYALSCRYISRSVFASWRILVGNPWLLGAVVFCLAIDILCVYTPGLNDVMTMAPIDAEHWGRLIPFSIAVFLLIEFERAVFPRFITPLVWPYAARLDAAIRAAFAALGRRAACAPSAASKAAAAAADVAAAAALTQDSDLAAAALPRPHHHVLHVAAPAEQQAERGGTEAAAVAAPLPAAAAVVAERTAVATTTAGDEEAAIYATTTSCVA